jgi:uncharacterized membrane protein YphA (DoxX/SURF4 family)
MEKSWHRTAASVAAILLALVFLVSGGWKVLQPFQTGELLEQAQVPAGLGTIGAAVLGTIELLTAVLLILPRYRRWGGLLGSALLVFFIGWIAVYYSKLVGQECSCFPFIKRTVGPGFFISDGVMLLLGLAAYFWSPKVRSLRIPSIAFASLAALAALSFGLNAQSRGKVEVPVPVMVDGKPADLSTGKVFVYFFDPQCMHCLAAAKFMSHMNWEGTRVVGVPTRMPEFAPDFLEDTKLKAATSLDVQKLKASFPFVDPPFGVALVDGHVKQTFSQAQFNEPMPRADLEKIGFIR